MTMLNANIETKRAALTALRKLGFSKSRMQMTRGATTYSHPEAPRFQITFGDTQFIATGGSAWSFLSAATCIDNLRFSANGRVLELLKAARELGIVGPTGPVTMLGLGVVCAAGALRAARTPPVELNQAEIMKATIASFPATFHLRCLPGHMFRVSERSSYFATLESKEPTLYTECLRDGEWHDFAKGSPSELRSQLVAVPS